MKPVLFVINAALVLLFLKSLTNANANNQLKLVTSFPGLSFYAGTVFHDWVFKEELHVAEALINATRGHTSQCNVVDVGMNDGFYSMMGAAIGCHVRSFEIQTRCIEVARRALDANKFGDRINITQAIVSNKDNATEDVQCTNFCFGGYSMSEATKKLRRLYYDKPIPLRHISLGTIFGAPGNPSPSSIFIHFLKVDTEGFESIVLEGAEALFRDSRVGVAVVEVIPHFWPVPFDAAHEKIFIRILSYGYIARCLKNHSLDSKCYIKTLHKKPCSDYAPPVDTTKTYATANVEEMLAAIRNASCVDWMFTKPTPASGSGK
jgi:FkbM family methyltransferase